MPNEALHYALCNVQETSELERLSMLDIIPASAKLMLAKAGVALKSVPTRARLHGQ